MGYDTNIAPPRPWFCGRVYLKEAKTLIDSIPSKGRTVRDVATCLAARLNIMRGIRVALQLASEDYSAKDVLWAGLEERIEPDRAQSLKCAYRPNFRYHIGGTGQYGVPNFQIVDNQHSEHESVSATSSEAADLISALVDERIAAANRLMAQAIEIFSWDVFVPEKQDDIHYYDIREGMDDENILEAIVDFGFAATIEDARNRWGDRIAADNLDLGEEVDLAFRKWNEESWVDMVNDDFWGWEENLSIYHSFSD